MLSHYSPVSTPALPQLSLLSVLIGTVLLTGCGGGGGGGGGSSNSNPTVTPETVNQPVVPTPPVTATSTGKVKVGIIDSGLQAGRSDINYANVSFTSWLAGASQTLNDNAGSP